MKRLNLLKIIKKNKIGLITQIVEGGYFGLKNTCPFNLLGYPTTEISGRLKGKYKRILIEVYGTTCSYCLKKITNKEDLTLDHVISRKNGGSNRPSNLVICCYKCNQEKKHLGIIHFLLRKYYDQL